MAMYRIGMGAIVPAFDPQRPAPLA